MYVCSLYLLVYGLCGPVTWRLSLIDVVIEAQVLGMTAANMVRANVGLECGSGCVGDGVDGGVVMDMWLRRGGLCRIYGGGRDVFGGAGGQYSGCEWGGGGIRGGVRSGGAGVDAAWGRVRLGMVVAKERGRPGVIGDDRGHVDYVMVGMGIVGPECGAGGDGVGRADGGGLGAMLLGQECGAIHWAAGSIRDRRWGESGDGSGSGGGEVEEGAGVWGRWMLVQWV